ncbi:polysaccharide deacetylase family protein [Oceanobacillus sp. FSL K6-2867]|uniref:polysaccharide deacetylase family protein n=1 Tax=Oceanobacillus sp. FSL K6-2867 TaxID=2954748 RepID=UPI0030DBC8BF
MLEISIPNSYKEERNYIIKVLLEEFLGLKMKIFYVDHQDYTLKLENGKLLIIKDAFFSTLSKGESYLNENQIPEEVLRAVNPFIIEKDIPVIFGTDKFEVTEEEVICGIDIFASSYFMLSRWEEYVNRRRDFHNRFSAKSSVAYKNNFLDRPIVNEYVEMLWNILESLGIEQERKERAFRFIPTHDIDHLRYWKGPYSLLRSLASSLKKKEFKQIPIKITDYLLTKTGKKKDPYDTFEEIMSISESQDIQSRFYFMTGGNSKFDEKYNIDNKMFVNLIESINERGHIIGIHPSYNTYTSVEMWSNEKRLLESIYSNSIIEGRQHYLRIAMPETLNIWEDNKMKVDSTLGYADYSGFRCGVCYEFPVFDFLNKKELNIKERPLIVMEGTLINYNKLTPKEVYLQTSELIKTVKRYDGDFVYLWHNSSYHINGWEDYKQVYYNILKNYKKI